MAYHGSLLMILDFKLISHMWARGLPNVAYAGLPAEIHTALMWLQAEILRRNQVALRAADIEGVVQANVGPRILVIAEELNATQNRLGAYWKTVREKGRPRPVAGDGGPRRGHVHRPPGQRQRPPDRPAAECESQRVRGRAGNPRRENPLRPVRRDVEDAVPRA